jgi:hypothetical protein
MCAAVPKTYAKLVHANTGWWGAFPVCLRLRVGDCVSMDSEGRLVYVENILDRPGWRKELSTQPVPFSGAQSYQAGASTRRAAGAGAKADVAGVAAVSAALEVTFSHAAGYLLGFTGAKGHRFRDVGRVRQWVLNSARSGNWEKDYAVITEVLETTATTALISEQKNTSVTLELKGSVSPVITGPINLADPAVHLTSTTWSGNGSTSECQDATPLYHCVRIKRKWYGPMYASLESTSDDTHPDVFIDDPYAEDDDSDGDEDV